MPCLGCGEQYPCFLCGSHVGVGHGLFMLLDNHRRWLCQNCVRKISRPQKD
jgi:hypothetical protein